MHLRHVGVTTTLLNPGAAQIDSKKGGAPVRDGGRLGGEAQLRIRRHGPIGSVAFGTLPAPGRLTPGYRFGGCISAGA